MMPARDRGVGGGNILAIEPHAFDRADEGDKQQQIDVEV